MSWKWRLEEQNLKHIFGEGIYFLNGIRDAPVAALHSHVATLFL